MNNFETLRVNYYHPETREYVASQDIIVDNSSAFKLPPYSTDVPVPDSADWPDNTIPVFDVISNTWSLVPDYRAMTYYDKATGVAISYALGVSPDTNSATIKKPSHPAMVWNEELNDWELTMDAQKQVKNTLLESAYCNDISEPFTIDNGKESFTVDAEKVLIAYNAFDGDKVSIRSIDGSYLTFTKAALKDVVDSINKARWEAVQKLWSLKDKVDKATKPAELAVINWIG